ncbi:MAG: PEP-CTERM sorting domain-containing protein [Planctomycetota bacterium]
MGFDLDLILENAFTIGLAEGTIINDVPLAGVAFDVEDFTGTGVLSGVAGLRITPLDLDPSVSSAEGNLDLVTIGFNTNAVPEPASGALLLFGFAALASRRRLRA